MKQGFMQEHWIDSNGSPAGGASWGTGFAISWQNGPLQSGNLSNAPGMSLTYRKEPNGAFVEDVIDAVIGRIEFYQESRFNCVENDNALYHLKKAAEELDSRTKDRVARGVEGTHNE